MKVGIVGAGVFGRTLSFLLQQKDISVTLFDRDNQEGTESCSFAAGGMLSPYCELETAESLVSQLGIDSLSLWPLLLKDLPPVFYEQFGSLIVGHPQDHRELLRFKDQIKNKSMGMNLGFFKAQLPFKEVQNESLRELEPDLDRRISAGLYFPQEGQVSARDYLKVVGEYLKGKITSRFNEEVLSLDSNQIITKEGKFSFDWVIDCRGLGAKSDLPSLRGVRGEIVHVQARDVHFTRPIRLIHPRYPVYIIPRPNHHFLIGATSLETDTRAPITVRSCMELLSAAYSIHSGFGEGVILETVVQVRPAFPHHRPEIIFKKGLMHINGLYRHGFLITPKLAQLVSQFLVSGQLPPTHSAYGEGVLFKEQKSL